MTTVSDDRERVASKVAAVLVAGSWGTALASVLAHNGYEVRLWTRSEAQAQMINDTHENTRYLPDCRLPDGIVATTDMRHAVEKAEVVLFVAPSAVLREVARQAAPFIPAEALCVHAVKGFETGTLKRMSTVLQEELGRDQSELVVLSGPSHAEEVIRRQPTTVVVAAEDTASATRAQEAFNNNDFRVYTNPDVVGVEVAGAIKNIIALGAGLTDGLGFGDNAKAALITRGLAEIGRLGAAMGANPLTFAGLAGVGDLVVTCTSQHSRNWRAGNMLSKGATLEEMLERMGMVVEGVKTTQSAHALATAYQVEMPIAFELYDVLFNGKEPRIAAQRLMGRTPTLEIRH